MRTPIIAAALAVALGCNVKYSSSSTPPTTEPTNSGPDDGKTIETAEPAGKPIAKADPEADKKAKEKAEFDAAMKELEAEAAKEKARWTPELEAQVAKLTGKKWGSAKVALTAALASQHRMPGHAERDASRHPIKTMEFFGLRPDMRVFEIGPGAGWWTELLAVVLAQRGKLVLAGYDANSDDYRIKYMARALELMLGKSPALYGKVETVPQAAPGAFDLGPADSLDMVVNMRMTHNLVRGGGFDKFLAASFTALKPGGILAIEQHRAAEGADPMQSSEKGYVPEAWLIQQAEAAGFKLEKKSEINANPKDTKDYPKGVWTLPPTFAEGDKDKAKYAEIGESDRMTLKFVKPKTKKKTPAAATDIKGTGPTGGDDPGKPAPAKPTEPAKKTTPGKSAEINTDKKAVDPEKAAK